MKQSINEMNKFVHNDKEGLKIQIDPEFFSMYRQLFSLNSDEVNSVKDEGLTSEEFVELYLKHQVFMVKTFEKNVNSYIALAAYIKQNDCNLDQQKQAALRLYYEIIRFSDSIITLLENGRLTGVNTLLRALFERYIFIKVISLDPEQAKSFLLKTEIQRIKTHGLMGRSSTLKTGFEQGFFEVEYEPEVLEQLKVIEEDYKSMFAKDANRDKWYNIHGNASSIEKLIHVYKLKKWMNFVYYEFSMEVHSGVSQMAVEDLLTVDFSKQVEDYPPLSSFFTVAAVLQDSDQLIRELFKDCH